MNIEQKQNKIIKPTSVYTMSAEEQNQITSELQNLISEGGITPSENDLTQVKSSVKNIVDTAISRIDLSGKANIAGGNMFTGQQTLAKTVEDNYNLSIYDMSSSVSADVKIAATGVKVETSNASYANIDVNDRTVFKNKTILGTIESTVNFGNYAIEGYYVGTLNGTAATFKLPIPTSAQLSKENTIVLLLNVSADTSVSWKNANNEDLNVNSEVSAFKAGKYEVRLRYDDNSSSWTAEVLKQTLVNSGTTKVDFELNGNLNAKAGNAEIIVATGYTPSFSDNTAFVGYKSLTSQDFNKFSIDFKNLVLTGPFTIHFWLRRGGNYASTILGNPNGVTGDKQQLNLLTFRMYSSDTGDSFVSKSLTRPSADFNFHYIEISRDIDGVVRSFIDGVKNNSDTTNTSAVYLRNCVCFELNYACLQDFVIEDKVGHVSDYSNNLPTAPFTTSDKFLADLHDETKQNDITTITGYDASKTQVLKNVQGVLVWIDEAQ